MQSLFPSVAVNGTRPYSLINCNTVEYALPPEYTFTDYLGGGNYGNVIKVKTADGEELAVKKMYDPFSSTVKARRVYRELKLLQLINHENIIRFVDIYTPDSDFRCFKNVYIVTNYAGVSLKQVLDKQKSAGIRLINFDHIKYIIYQLLRALKYLHSANVIHRDLKPSNLSITEECDLTVLDFGLARTVSTNNDNLTAYVISRWYRSPEVIYWNSVSYNAKADVWSVGCILAELLTGKVLFPGSEAMEQYRLIINLCGSPERDLMDKVEQQNSPAMRMVMERMGGYAQRKNFREFFRQPIPDDAVDLLNKILMLDPDKRISVEEALQHPYMKEYSMPDDEPTVDRPFNIEEENDIAKSVVNWKEIIWKEIQMYRARISQTVNGHKCCDPDENSMQVENNCDIHDSQNVL
ncbi:protein kinase domain-containing protein [Ditylenchus destructor]|uniref:mitogen-activated protein kinase n=1 Tax=Ditylenchus destructor TaxID=166010 RepID=A0AAD4N5W6_9BILA|nr:protein kinase domain-containing protein [Ditylenchus destructor]